MAQQQTSRPAWATAAEARPLLALVLGTVLAMVLAYAWRPSVGISLGTNYDAPFLEGAQVNAREFRASEPTVDIPWPAGSDTLVIDTSAMPGYTMATITVDGFKPAGEFQRRLMSLYANGDEINNFNDDGGSREFRSLLPAGAVSGGRLTLRAITIPDRNTTKTPPLQVQKVTLSNARTYRWTTGHTTLLFPSLGGGDWRVTLRGIVYHPDGTPSDAKLYANGTLVASLPDYAGAKEFSAIIPASAVGGGDLTLSIDAAPYTDPRELGVLVEQVRLTPVGSGSPLPPLGVLLPMMAIVLGAYGSLRRAGIWRWWAAGAALALVAVGAWAMVAFRYPMGFYLQPLAAVVLLGLALALLFSWGCDRLFARLGVPIAPWLRDALVLVFLIGFWLKAGGLVFPYMRAIDIQWHMAWVRKLISGEVSFGQLYSTDSPLNDLTMPVDEWGASRPVIPYSPFFQLFAVLFAVFPWKLEHTANVLSAVIDNSRVFLIALIALKAGLSRREALLAALLYAITPATFLLHAWGNIPTTFAMWLSLVATAIVVTCWDRLHRPWPFAALTLVTLACLLFYTVMAAFHMAFVVLFVLAVALMRKQLDSRPLKPMLLATGLALALSLLIYYGQYIVPILTTTVPYVATVFTKGPESVGVERPSLGAYLADYGPHLLYWMLPGRYLYYGILLPLLALIPGFVMLRRRQPLWAALTAWFGVALLFMLVGYRISMVDKQIFYSIPAMCLCAAPVADWVWRKGLWGRVLIAAIYLGTFASALALWVIRIQRSPFG
ncbi:hypothetical protein F8S13_20240 [Chloroflexia bacterium SDU3-3]|nr:hypothetical protein F8S13_20240 [Chloroflexia bacterium SDU3-3]